MFLKKIKSKLLALEDAHFGETWKLRSEIRDLKKEVERLDGVINGLVDDRDFLDRGCSDRISRIETVLKQVPTRQVNAYEFDLGKGVVRKVSNGLHVEDVKQPKKSR